MPVYFSIILYIQLNPYVVANFFHFLIRRALYLLNRPSGIHILSRLTRFVNSETIDSELYSSHPETKLDRQLRDEMDE